MTNVDVKILELLAEHELWMAPSNIAKNIDASKQYTRREAKRLWEDGLLDREMDGKRPYYKINSAGRKRLNNELKMDSDA